METLCYNWLQMETTSDKWYKKTWAIIIALVLFFPAGLFLMWKYTSWNKPLKWIVTGVFALIVLGGIASDNSQPTPKTTTEAVSNNNIQPTNSAPTSTPKPVEKVDIVVTSQIVKKVDGKCRYFFDIRNKDTENFEGGVTIALFTNELKNRLAGDTFNTTKPIEPELGTVVYTDANTCPASIHGANGITKFTYTVNVNNAEVNKGEGAISDEFEDLDAYGL